MSFLEFMSVMNAMETVSVGSRVDRAHSEMRRQAQSIGRIEAKVEAMARSQEEAQLGARRLTTLKDELYRLSRLLRSAADGNGANGALTYMMARRFQRWVELNNISTAAFPEVEFKDLLVSCMDASRANGRDAAQRLEPEDVSRLDEYVRVSSALPVLEGAYRWSRCCDLLPRKSWGRGFIGLVVWIAVFLIVVAVGAPIGMALIDRLSTNPLFDLVLGFVLVLGPVLVIPSLAVGLVSSLLWGRKEARAVAEINGLMTEAGQSFKAPEAIHQARDRYLEALAVLEPEISRDTRSLEQVLSERKKWCREVEAYFFRPATPDPLPEGSRTT